MSNRGFSVFCEDTVKKRAHITARDIERGKRGQCAECPAALAINRLLAAGWTSQVFGDSIHFEKPVESIFENDPFSKKRVFVKGPEALFTFILMYDNYHANVKPVSFDIEIPVGVARKGVFK